MINSLRLLNFKAFENQLLNFKSLTVLSGYNSTSKSCVLQALSLLHQSYQQGLLQNTGLLLNGNLVNIGRARDALCENAKEDYVGFELIFKNDTKGIWHFNYNSLEREADVLEIGFKSVDADIYQSSIFSREFHHLQSERAITTSGILNYQRQQLKQIGALGEYTAHFLYTYGSQPIPIAQLSHPQAKSINLIDQVEAWLGEISSSLRIQVNANLDIDWVNLKFSDNVGYGITYVLPIIVAILASSPGALILIEHPETGLHLQAQTKLGKLLALAANCGVQVVVETHSDQILNGIRLAVHDGKLEPEDVQLHYFQRQEQQGQASIKVVSPRIDKDGRIDRWPDGFFDEWDNSLTVLLEPAKS
ncbi:ABC transporter permease [Nostoc sp. ATCC 43529]|nr:ABC transporter permease [Nostoc sp. ATCC 43529]